MLRIAAERMLKKGNEVIAQAWHTEYAAWVEPDCIVYKKMTGTEPAEIVYEVQCQTEVWGLSVSDGKVAAVLYERPFMVFVVLDVPANRRPRRLHRQFSGGRGNSGCQVEFSACGALLMLFEKRLRLWSSSVAGQCKHWKNVVMATFTPGNIVFVQSSVRHGDDQGVYELPEHAVALSCSPAANETVGVHLVSGRLLVLQDGCAVATLECVDAFTFGPTGNLFAAVEKRVMRVNEHGLTTPTKVPDFCECVHHISCSKDLLASVSMFGGVEIYDVATGECLYVDPSCEEVAFVGDTILLSAGDGSLKILERSTYVRTSLLQKKSSIRFADFDKEVCAVSFEEGTVSSLILSSQSELKEAAVDGTLVDTKVMGRTVLLPSMGHVSVHSKSDALRLRTIEGRLLASSRTHICTRTHDGLQLTQIEPGVTLVSCFYDLNLGTLLSAAFSPKGERLATGTVPGRVMIWSTSDGAPLQTLATVGSVTQLLYSTDFLFCLTTNCLYNKRDARLLPLKGHNTANVCGNVYTMALHDDLAALCTETGIALVNLRQIMNGKRTFKTSKVMEGVWPLEEVGLQFDGKGARLIVQTVWSAYVFDTEYQTNLFCISTPFPVHSVATSEARILVSTSRAVQIFEPFDLAASRKVADVVRRRIKHLYTGNGKHTQEQNVPFYMLPAEVLEVILSIVEK